MSLHGQVFFANIYIYTNIHFDYFLQKIQGRPSKLLLYSTLKD